MKFFITCGFGMTPFFKNELDNKFRPSSVSESMEILGDGKISFELHEEELKTTKSQLKIVLSLVDKLKTVERLFGFVVNESIDPKLNMRTRRALLSHYFQVASNPTLTKCLEFWGSVKHALSNITETPEDDDEIPETKRRKLPENCTETGENESSPSVGFRISTKLHGLPNSLMHSQEVSKTIGTAIVKQMCGKGWRIKLRDPDLEITVSISETQILMGIPLTNKPLSERSYLTNIPLRSTVSYAMASLIFDSDTNTNLESPKSLMILDPMCGAATILVEIAKNFPTDIGLLCGVDFDRNQLIKAQENLMKAEVGTAINLIQGDCSKLSFQMKFDSIVCDIPFGKQHGSVDETKRNLEEYLKSFDNNLVSNGKTVLLISEELSRFLENTVINSKDLNWVLKNKFPMKQGVLASVIFLFEKVN